jgi:Arc/MetJ family transcription regulator
MQYARRNGDSKMRTTITVDDELLAQAARISQQSKPSRIIEASLKEYVLDEVAAKVSAGYLQSLDRQLLISSAELNKRMDDLLKRKCAGK